MNHQNDATDENPCDCPRCTLGRNVATLLTAHLEAKHPVSDVFQVLAITLDGMMESAPPQTRETIAILLDMTIRHLHVRLRSLEDIAADVGVGRVIDGLISVMIAKAKAKAKEADVSRETPAADPDPDPDDATPREATTPSGAMTWTFLHPKMTYQHLGYLPGFLHPADPRPAREQFQENYVSGWNPMEGFSVDENHHLTYPGDPPLKPVAMTKLRDETIRLYPADWVMITQPDGTHSIARID